MPQKIALGNDPKTRAAYDLMLLIADGEKKAGVADRNRSNWLQRFEACRQIVAGSRDMPADEGQSG
jgi:hypothetical protein